MHPGRNPLSYTHGGDQRHSLGPQNIGSRGASQPGRQSLPPVQSQPPSTRQSLGPASAENGQPMRQPTADEEAEFARQKVSGSLTRYVETFQFPYINDVTNYEKVQKIGQGTFGEVFKARCKKTGRMVALKKILMENEKEGFPITALREVKMLQQLRHQHVTELIEICSSTSSTNHKDRSTFYLVFTFCNHDLAGLLSNEKVQLNLVHRKTLMKHLLLGLYQIHRCKILHRDMKAANVLISGDGVLKLADFGLARPYTASLDKTTQHAYTNRVVTLWYRPPELLLGERHYATAIDMWGAGCIMAELWTRTPIMQGDTEQRQLSLISRLCGSICPENWVGVEQLPLYGKMQLEEGLKRRVHERLFPIIKNDEAMKLLEALLSLDPTKRPGAEEALDDVFFYKEPMPTDTVIDLMKSLNQESMFEYTMGRGAHQNRGRAVQQQQQQRQQQQRQAPNQDGGYRDMVY